MKWHKENGYEIIALETGEDIPSINDVKWPEKGLIILGNEELGIAPELMAVMSPVEAIVEQGAEALRIEAFAEPMFAATIVANGVFIGAGDTLIPAIMSLASMWGVRLTLAASLAPRFGLKGVWTAMAIDLSVRGILFLTRLFKGKWYKNIRS